MKQNIAIRITKNHPNPMFMPTGTTLLYLTIIARRVPRIPPNNGPTYGIILRRPVRNAIPIDALNPRRMMKNNPRKFRNATPIISTTTPEK